jgi:hypothetical protein
MEKYNYIVINFMEHRFLEKLIVSQLVKKFPVHCGTQRFSREVYQKLHIYYGVGKRPQRNKIIRTGSMLECSQMVITGISSEPDKSSLHPPPVSLRSILILSSHAY